jgi:hypothetical protein
MQYIIFSYFVVIFLVVLAIEISCARQKIAYSANGPKSFNPKTIALTDNCPNCRVEIDTNTAVCKHCGSFVCYFWYKP